MVGRQALNLLIWVRILAPEPVSLLRNRPMAGRETLTLAI
jgi:hypothetical protein